MSKGNEQYSIYTIPYNFIDESKLFGGMVSARNFVEGCILGGIASTPVFLISLPLQIKLTLILVFFLVFGVIGCIGINGDPISRFVVYFIKFRKEKRIISFNGKVKFHESAADNIEFSELPRDRILKLFAGMSTSRKAAETMDAPEETDDFVFDDDIVSSENKKDILSKLLGKKNSTVYDDTYDAAIADEFLYQNNAENAADEDETNNPSQELHAEFDTDNDIDMDFEIDTNINTDDFYEEQDLSDAYEDGSVFNDIEDTDTLPTIEIDERDFIEPGIDMNMEESEDSFVDVSEVMKNAITNTEEWQCKFCQTINDGKFCEECGAAKESAAM